MGIPKQVEQMEEEADKALEQDAQFEANGGAITMQGAQPAPTQSAQPAAQQPPVPEPPPNPAPAPSTEQPTLASEKDLQRMRSMLGRLSKSQEEKERSQHELEALRARAEKAEAERDEARALAESLKSSPVRSPANSGAEFTDEQIAKIREVLNKNGADYSIDEVKPLAEAMRLISGGGTDEVKTELAELRKERQEQRVAQFKSRLDADFPGFAELDAKRDPRWMQFLSGPLPEPMDGITYERFAGDALDRLDYRSFSWVVRQFLAQNSSVLPGVAGGASDAVRGQIRPASVPGARTGQQKETQKPRVPRSEIDQFYHAYYAKRAEARYGLTAEQVRERLAFYEEAEAEDRVDETR
jgi:hypothetical protein